MTPDFYTRILNFKLKERVKVDVPPLQGETMYTCKYDFKANIHISKKYNQQIWHKPAGYSGVLMSQVPEISKLLSDLGTLARRLVLLKA